MSTRKLNAAFAQLIQSRKDQAAQPAVALESVSPQSQEILEPGVEKVDLPEPDPKVIGTPDGEEAPVLQPKPLPDATVPTVGAVPGITSKTDEEVIPVAEAVPAVATEATPKAAPVVEPATVVAPVAEPVVATEATPVAATETPVVSTEDTRTEPMVIDPPDEVELDETPDEVVDPTVAITDPNVAAIDEAAALVSAPAVAEVAEVGEGELPVEVAAEIDPTATPSESAEAPAVDTLPETVGVPVVEPGADPVTEPVITEDVLIDPVSGVTVTDADASVVVTDPVADVVDDSLAAIAEGTSTQDDEDEALLLSEEELKAVEFKSHGINETLQVIDAMTVKITELEGEIGQYENGLSSMKKITEVLDTSAEEGGISDHAASILKIAIEHISEQLGMGESVALGIPSLESFSLKASRQSATSLALEDIKETVNKIWAAIQAGYKKVMEWLGDFFKHVFDVSARLATRATQIQALAATVTKSNSGMSFENPRLAKALAHGPKVSTNITQELENLNKFASAAATGSSSMLQKLAPMVKRVQTLMEDDASTTADFESNQSELIDLGLKFQSSLASAGGLKKNSGDSQKWYSLPPSTDTVDLYTSNIWLGNKIVYAYVPNHGGPGYRAGQATADVGTIAPGCPVLSSKDIAAVAAIVIEHAKDAKSGQALWAEMQDLYKTVLATATIANSTAAVQNKGGYEKFKMLAAFVKDARALSSGLQQPALAIATAANAAALDYAHASLKMLNSKHTVSAGMVPATEQLQEEEEEVSLEGVADLHTLKKTLTSGKDDDFKNDLESKQNVLKKERQNLEKLKKAMALSKDEGSHVINLKKSQGKWNFTATNPAHLIAGLTKNAKYIESIAAKIKTVKTKDDALALQSQVDAEMSKEGTVPESMAFTRLQSQGYIEASVHLVESMMHYLSALGTISGHHALTEGAAKAGKSFWKEPAFQVILSIFSTLSKSVVFYTTLGVRAANPFLGSGTGIRLFGVSLTGSKKIADKYREKGAGTSTGHHPHLPVSEATHGMQPAAM